MATSSIPAAIDYLVATVRAFPQAAAPVVVTDGWPDEKAPTGVVIGIDPEDDATENVNVYAQVGAQVEWEEYFIPCVIWAYKGGSDMKAARDAAFVLYDALLTHLKTTAGRTLGGALHSGTARATNVRIVQTGSNAEAGAGRRCDIYFAVHCRNRF